MVPGTDLVVQFVPDVDGDDGAVDQPAIAEGVFSPPTDGDELMVDPEDAMVLAPLTEDDRNSTVVLKSSTKQPSLRMDDSPSPLSGKKDAVSIEQTTVVSKSSTPSTSEPAASLPENSADAESVVGDASLHGDDAMETGAEVQESWAPLPEDIMEVEFGAQAQARAPSPPLQNSIEEQLQDLLDDPMEPGLAELDTEAYVDSVMRDLIDGDQRGSGVDDPQAEQQLRTTKEISAQDIIPSTITVDTNVYGGEPAAAALPQEQSAQGGGQTQDHAQLLEVISQTRDQIRIKTEPGVKFDTTDTSVVIPSSIPHWHAVNKRTMPQGLSPKKTTPAKPSSTAQLEQPLVDLTVGSEHGEDEEWDNGYADDEHEDDEQSASLRMAPTQQLLFDQTFLTEEQWIEVCTVLDHPVEKRDGLKLLPGTQQGLLIHQMAFIVRAMKCHRTRAELTGLLLADNVGLGKSICALGLFAVSSLVLHNLRHWYQHKSEHLPNTAAPGSHCPLNNPFGIQCVCVPDSITLEYSNQLVCGPSVLTVPANNLDAWERRITKYFHKYVQAKDSDVNQIMIEPVSYRDSGLLSPIILDGRRTIVDAGEIIAKVKTTSNMLPASTVRGRPLRNVLSYEDLCEDYEEEVSLRFELPKLENVQFRFLILVSFSALSNPKCALSRIFGVKVPFYAPRMAPGTMLGRRTIPDRAPHRVVHVEIPFTVAVNLFMFDESHSVTKYGTQLFRIFREAKRLSTVTRQRKTRWFFMTATPFSHSPLDIFACLELLVSNREEKNRLLGELREFEKRFKRESPKSGTRQLGTKSLALDSAASFARDFSSFVKPFTVARDWGSPYLDTSLEDMRPGIKRHAVRVSLPPTLEGVIERLGARCRRELAVQQAKKHRQRPVRDLEETIFTQYFSAGIMPGIAVMLENHDGFVIPASVKQVDEDFRLGEASVMRNTLHYHEGHDWTLKLREIVKLAHSDREGNTAEIKQGPRHILLVAQTPALVGFLTHFLQNDSHLRHITHAIRIFQNVTPNPAGRDTFLQKVAAEAASSDRSYVVITTPKLVGIGIDIVFCSYFIQFGEIFSNRDREQLIGRVNRPGQKLPVHHYHIISSHQSHTEVRDRNNGRSAMLSEHAGREQ